MNPIKLRYTARHYGYILNKSRQINGRIDFTAKDLNKWFPSRFPTPTCGEGLVQRFKMVATGHGPHYYADKPNNWVNVMVEALENYGIHGVKSPVWSSVPGTSKGVAGNGKGSKETNTRVLFSQEDMNEKTKRAIILRKNGMTDEGSGVWSHMDGDFKIAFPSGHKYVRAHGEESLRIFHRNGQCLVLCQPSHGAYVPLGCEFGQLNVHEAIRLCKLFNKFEADLKDKAA